MQKGSEYYKMKQESKITHPESPHAHRVKITQLFKQSRSNSLRKTLENNFSPGYNSFRASQISITNLIMSFVDTYILNKGINFKNVGKELYQNFTKIFRHMTTCLILLNESKITLN